MNKKRVGLLTYHHTTNFGSLLQSYALYRTVINMGFDCEVIDYRNSAVESREFIKRFYNCNNLHELKGHLKYGGYKKKKAKAFSEFLLEKIKISEKSYSLENISEVNDIYDCFLIGSDLVWDFSINGHDTTYMLDFAKNDVSKLAYASSVGSLWQGEEKKDVITLLNKFNAIGVRESAICDMLKSELIIPVEFVAVHDVIQRIKVSLEDSTLLLLQKGKDFLLRFLDVVQLLVDSHQSDRHKKHCRITGKRGHPGLSTTNSTGGSFQ